MLCGATDCVYRSSCRTFRRPLTSQDSVHVSRCNLDTGYLMCARGAVAPGASSSDESVVMESLKFEKKTSLAEPGLYTNMCTLPALQSSINSAPQTQG